MFRYIAETSDSPDLFRYTAEAAADGSILCPMPGLIFQKGNRNMTKEQLFSTLVQALKDLAAENGLETSEIRIISSGLTPEEAIGITKRKDYPILNGEEIMLQAEFDGAIGQAFTSSPASYVGTLDEILNADLENDDQARALFIAAMNAVMRRLGQCGHTIHCKNDGPELCAAKFGDYIAKNYGNPKIGVVGYQPALLSELCSHFTVRALDLNPANVGEERFGITIEHGVNDMASVQEWADLILCTGSTLANASIVDYMNLDKEVIFFGTTAAGACEVLGLHRECFESM